MLMIDAELIAGRRAPELQAVSAKEGSAPLGVTSKRHLEVALEEIGSEFLRGLAKCGQGEKLLRTAPPCSSHSSSSCKRSA